MVKINKIYTGTGDSGMTHLVTNERVSKSSCRIKAAGEVDSLNSILGVVRLYVEGEFLDLISLIQNDLFDLGADIATPLNKTGKEDLRIVNHQVTTIEEKIDLYNDQLQSLRSFILPGSGNDNPAGAWFHVARATARSAERAVIELSETEEINMLTAAYLNRLSDLFFCLARYVNDKGANDILWIPGKNR